ncbi:Omega-crystallin [Dactylella cylindrospora]|nr:Omega-crystallin [Dactylella cylindrospora]
MSGKPVLTTISPITQQPIHTRDELTPDEIPSIVEASKKAFKNFKSSYDLAARQSIVSKALDILESKADSLARDLTEQMGRPIQYCANEVKTAVKRGRYMLKVSTDVLKDVPGEEEAGFTRYIRKEPLGTVLVIFAWNYPYLILVNSLVPALLAGNALILKPSPQTPTIPETFLSVLREAGLPENVVQVIHCGDPDTLSKLISTPGISSVTFTGSVVGGLAAQQAASKRIIPVGLELGGNDPAYIRPDVDIKWAAEEIVDGAVFNSGQSCCSIERVYVHQDVYDQFVEAVVGVVNNYKLGDPFTGSNHLGPVISVKSAQNIRKHIEEALASGAKSLTPDVFKEGEALGETFVRPEILADVNHDMRVMKEETFGPVIPIQKVASDEEAIQLMNDSDLGLTASIWTRDIPTGHKLAEEIEAGTVFVNRADYPSPDLAWTGWKNSGRGQTLSKFGFDQFVRLKNFHLKQAPPS